jgi:hypothetical protein
MSPPPNHVYSAFSFIGFVITFVPFYWHLEGMRIVITCFGVHLTYLLGTLRRSLEHRDLYVYALDGSWMPGAMYQFDCVGQKHYR